jgi:hypothetical protein
MSVRGISSRDHRCPINRGIWFATPISLRELTEIEAERPR